MRGIEPGSVFAGHRIEEIAGRGGMGVVYRATHIALDHVVALKVISPDLVGDEQFRQRFQSEFRIAVSIRHPNVVSVHHAGEEEGLLFVTMDFIEGTDVRGLLNREGHLEPPRAATILAQVSSALDAAHSRGLIHRDIKPGNVLIEARPSRRPPEEAGSRTPDHAYLTDFGLARAIDAETGLTASGAFIGTLDYAAPEQIKGDRLDARTDVYALGCLLHELLAGSTPFSKQTEKVAKMYAHLSEPPPDLRELRPELPADVPDVVARAMAKEPDDRFQSAGDLARAAEAAIEGRQPSQDERTVAIGEAAPAATVAAAAVPPPAVDEPTLREPPPSQGETAAELPPTAAPPPTAPPPGAPATPPTEERPGEPPRPEPETRPVAPGRDVARRRRIAALGIGGAAVVAAVVAVIALSGGGDPETGPSSEPTGGGGGEQGGGGVDLSGARLVGNPIPVDGMPVGIAAGFGQVWIGQRLGGTLSRLDPKSKQVSVVTSVSEPEGVTVGPRSVYVAAGGSDQVLRLDDQGNLENEIPVGGFPRAIAHGEGGIFVTNGLSSSVTRVDIGPDSAEVVADIPVGASPHGIAIGEGGVWVANRDADSVSQIDPASNQVVEEIAVGDNPKGVAIAEGTVWVTNTDSGTVTPIEAGTAKAGKPIAVGAEPRGAVAGFDSVWIANGGGSVSRIDPASGEVADEIEVGPSPEEVTVGEKFVYVSAGDGQSVSRIKP